MNVLNCMNLMNSHKFIYNHNGVSNCNSLPWSKFRERLASLLQSELPYWGLPGGTGP